MYVYDKAIYKKIIDGELSPGLFVFYSGKPAAKLPIKASMLFEDLVANTGIDDGICVIDTVQRVNTTAYWFTGNRITSVSLPFSAGVYIYGIGIAYKTDSTYVLVSWKTVNNEQVRPGAELVISVDLEDTHE